MLVKKKNLKNLQRSLKLISEVATNNNSLETFAQGNHSHTIGKTKHEKLVAIPFGVACGT